MTVYTELEMTLRRRDADYYVLALNFVRPDSDADINLGQASVHFDFQQLQILDINAESYGKTLTDYLFATADMRAAFAKACSNSQSLSALLRIRLHIDAACPELHSLRWETLRDPDTGDPLLTGEQTAFSRYLSSADWRPVQLRPQRRLQAVAMIANPLDLEEYQFAPVDVAGESARVKSALGTNISLTELSGTGQATLTNLLKQLREGTDILYLVCHGALIKGESWLWLEDEQGKTARAAGAELVTRLRELSEPPRLIVLASCQSAGTGELAGAEKTQRDEESALTALGPRLAQTGIPAVLAMQGKITMQTVAEFMPCFFHELQRDGQIDRAVAVARGTVRARSDSWMPVLFMRLKAGRIWYVPGFGGERADFEKWPTLLESIEEGGCTPILGTGLIDSVIGGHRELAQRWAEEYRFPLAAYQRDDLPQVAQYLAVNQGRMFPRKSLKQHLMRELRQRYKRVLADTAGMSLEEILEILGEHYHEQKADTPYQILSRLPFSIYITADPSGLLAQFLRAAGKDAQVELCRWNADVMRLPSLYDEQPKYRPTTRRPLVYQLFGNLEEPRSLVLTEDDYFNYLIGVTRNNDLIPRAVRSKLSDSTLLFLGFDVDEWDFRVLFHSIMGQEGSERLNDYAHVAVQIEPEEGRIVDPERARRYLESYFQNAKISIYWGNVENFIQEIARRWEERQQENF
ncbi:MAG: CHAT domain-containing protein [Gammaproteobacteria bacterium]|nr:CHAT domain-containing protein [Gammaproteobacteria bacterium]